MKKMSLFAIVLFSVVTLTACGASKNVSQNNSQKSGGNPFGPTYQAPCAVFDTPQEFAATGIFRGSSHQMGDVEMNALLDAQRKIRLKMQHAYKGMLSDYNSSIGNNKGNDIERKMTTAGDRIIDAILNETSQSCTLWSEVESDGHITCYTAIKISKQETAQRIAKEVEDKLTQSEKDRIGFNEEQYRKRMDDAFKQYQEDNK